MQKLMRIIKCEKSVSDDSEKNTNPNIFEIWLILTHVCPMYFPILINWTSPFPM